jgi:single-strand DNA-binding protein
MIMSIIRDRITEINAVGNLVDDPELKFTKSGHAMCRFTLAVGSRTRNKQTLEWEDGESVYHRCTAWFQLAENIAESCVKGTRVLIKGRLERHEWVKEDGSKDGMLVVEVDDLAPTLRFKPAQVERQRKAGDWQAA